MGRPNRSTVDIILVDKVKGAVQASLDSHNSARESPVSYERWVEQLDFGGARVKTLLDRIVLIIAADVRRRDIMQSTFTSRHITSPTARPRQRVPSPSRHLYFDDGANSGDFPAGNNPDAETDIADFESNFAGAHDPVTGEPLRGSYERVIRRARREAAVMEDSDTSDDVETDFVIIDEVVHDTIPGADGPERVWTAAEDRAAVAMVRGLQREQAAAWARIRRPQAAEHGLSHWPGAADVDIDGPVYPALGSAVPLSGQGRVNIENGVRIHHTSGDRLASSFWPVTTMDTYSPPYSAPTPPLDGLVSPPPQASLQPAAAPTPPIGPYEDDVNSFSMVHASAPTPPHHHALLSLSTYRDSLSPDPIPAPTPASHTQAVADRAALRAELRASEGARLSRQPSIRGPRLIQRDPADFVGSFSGVAGEVRRHQRARAAVQRGIDDEYRRRRVPASSSTNAAATQPAASSSTLPAALGAGWAETAFDDNFIAYFGDDL